MELRLCDFGMAKMHCESTVTQITQSTAVGSIRWRAPETYEENYKWSRKADIFSLGMTIFEIVTRKIPLDRESDNLVVRVNYQLGKYPSLEGVISKEIRDIILKCWNTDPDKRPFCEELLEDIKSIITSGGSISDVQEVDSSKIGASTLNSSNASLSFVSPISSASSTVSDT